MKRSVTFLIWLVCGMVFCTFSHGADAQNASRPNAANLDDLRQKMTLQNRIELMKKLHPKGPRANLPNGMQPTAANIPTIGRAPANAMQPNNNTDASNPYNSIAARNVFGLNPIPPPAPPQDPNAIPPPKITLTGITTIFGPAEALYKVAAYAKNGKQVPEQSYILTEGESQDDIEVTMIDTQKDIVTFNNHDQTQVIPLANGMATGGGSGGGEPSRPAGFARRFGGGFQAQAGGGYNNPNGNNYTPAGQMNNSGYNSPYNSSYNNNNNNASGQSALSPDDKAALISAQHAQLEQQGNPMAAIFPPTVYDDQARQEAGGSGGSSSGAPAPPTP
jgi:hypothetical protein